jgi:hypothetical protein
MSPAQLAKLHADFGDVDDLEAVIAQALVYPSAKKYPTGQYLYVRGWLRDERAKQIGRRPQNANIRNGYRPPDAASPYSLESLRGRANFVEG